MASKAPAVECEVQRNDVPVQMMVEAWDWRCPSCGHVSRGHVSERAARKDYAQHACQRF